MVRCVCGDDDGLCTIKNDFGFTENDQFYEMKEEKIIKIWTLITTFINI